MAQPVRAPARQTYAAQAFGHGQDHDQNDQALDQQLALGQQLGHLTDGGIGERPDDGTGEAREATEQNHQEGLGGAMPADQLGIYEAFLHRIHVAGDAGQQSCRGEGGQLVAIGLKAQRQHTPFVHPDALEHAAKHGAQENDEAQIHDHQQSKREVIGGERALPSGERQLPVEER